MIRPTLLIADDNAELRTLVRSTLRRDYPDAIEVSDGRELFWQLLCASFASERAPKRDYVVIADVCMPAYNGLDVLDAWHDESRVGPMVVITSYPDDNVRARVARLGAILLPKPFTRARLRHAVDEAARQLQNDK